MDKKEAYTLLFTDSLVGNLVISLQNEFAIYSMNLFGGYNTFIMLIVGWLASVFAIFFNYILGKFLFNIVRPKKENIFHVRYNEFSDSFNKYYFLFLLVSVVPFFGKFMHSLTGFLNFNFLKTLLICSSLKFCYYLFKLLF